MTTSTSPGPKGTVPEPPPLNVSPSTSSGGAEGLRAVADAVRAAYGDDAVLTDRQQLRTYECDGLAAYRVVPGLVVFARTTEQGATAIRACHEHGVPFVARGSGTGLSGGALPHAEGVLLVTAQMRKVLAVRPEDERAVVQPGVINLEVTGAAAPHGY
jgi:glycolate oxidase